jgi:hypothetical protein
MAAQAAQQNVRLEQRSEMDLPAVRLHTRFFAEALVRLIENELGSVRSEAPRLLTVGVCARTGQVEVRILEGRQAGYQAQWAEAQTTLERSVHDEKKSYEAGDPIFASDHEGMARRAQPKGSPHEVSLGLSVARGLIEVQGGALSLDDRAGDRRGVCFWLPALEPDAI